MSRRRGADLEEALLEAAWAELTEFGYARLTMEGVAARAGTSRPVLARRWEGKAELAVAAIRRQFAKAPVEVPDRGEVRRELLEFLDKLSGRTNAITAIFSLFAGEYVRETQSTLQDLRAALIAGGPHALTDILDRAVARGEIDREKLIPPVATLLRDLARHHALMTFAPPPPELREVWVDSIFLPLVRPEDWPSNRAGARAGAQAGD